MQHARAQDTFSKAYTELNQNIKKALAKSKNSNLKDRFCSLGIFHNCYAYLSLDASIKNKYVILVELQRFKSSNEDDLKDINVFEEYGAALNPLESAFDLCRVEYENNCGDTFQDLLNREGVPNGLPKGYCFHDIIRGLQEGGRIPDKESIPFIVHLSLYCFDMPPQDFKNLSKFQSIEQLEVKVFGEFPPSFEPISKLYKLRHLSIGHCPVSDLAPLARLKNLNYIEFDACGCLSDITPLAEITSLETVFFFDSKVSDHSPLLSLENLALFSTTDTNESAQAVHQKVQARRDAHEMQSLS